MSDGALLRTFSLPLNDDVEAVAFAPDGLRVAGGGGSDWSRVWRVADGAVLNTQETGSFFRRLAFSPDGSFLAMTLGWGNIRLLDGNTYVYWGKLGPDDDAPTARTFAFSPDGSLIAVLTDERVATVYRLPDKSVLTNFYCRTIPNPTNDDEVILVDTNWVSYYGDVAFSPDGRWLALAREDGRTDLRNVTNQWAVERTIGAGGWWLAFSPDSKLLGMVSDGVVKFWRVRDGQLLVSYPRESSEITSLAIGPDGKHFAYGRFDGTVVVARMPVVVTKASAMTNQIQMDWQGGSGLYQLQQTSNVAGAVWQNVGGPTTNTSTTVPITATNTFFRLQSLPNAP